MKTLVMVVVATLAAGLACGVELSLTFDEPMLMLNEPVMARVTIGNRGRHELHVGGSQARLGFIVEREPAARELKAFGSAPTLEPVRVAARSSHALAIDLSHRYDLSVAGRYMFWATIEKDGQTVRSRPRVVDIVRGLEMLSQTHDVYGLPGQDRTYSLRYMKRKDHERLFLCVAEEPSGNSFGAVELGKVIRVQQPTLDVTFMGTVRIRHQSGPHEITETVLVSDADGLSLKSSRTEPLHGDDEPTAEAPSSGR